MLNGGDICGEQGRHDFCLQLSDARLGGNINQVVTQIYFTNVIITMMGVGGERNIGNQDYKIQVLRLV